MVRLLNADQRKEDPLEDQEKIGTEEEQDVEAHRKRLATDEEPKQEGESEDSDFELHRKRLG